MIPAKVPGTLDGEGTVLICSAASGEEIEEVESEGRVEVVAPGGVIREDVREGVELEAGFLEGEF